MDGLGSLSLPVYIVYLAKYTLQTMYAFGHGGVDGVIVGDVHFLEEAHLQ